MATRDLAGQVLDGRYRIVEPIGKGAMGSVYRGEHLKLGRIVAIKVINEHVPAAMSSRARFDREARAMAKLEHPHCASVLDVGLYEDMPYVVMDFVSGPDLKEVLKAGPVPIDRAIEIMRQLLSGLGHAHEHGIVHRDIKPANIVLSQKSGLGDHVKILDFGLAKFNQETSNLTSGIVVGTPSYMAPEQILGGGRPIDHRADLYSCGALLFELLTGTAPFDSANREPVQVCMMHLNVAPPTLAEVVPGRDFGALEAVVAKALEKLPDDRFASAEEFAAALAEIQPAGRTRAQPAPSAVPAVNTTVPQSPTAQTTVDPPIVSSRRSRGTKRRHFAIGLGAIVFVSTAVIVLVVRLSSDTTAPAPPPPPPSAPVAAPPPPPPAAADPIADLLARADELAKAGRREAGIDVLVKARKTFPTDARLPYHAGLMYMDRMWWADGLKQLRGAIALDPKLKTDERLIRAVLRGFNTTASYDWTLASFLRKDIGAPAKPYLEEAARDHTNPLIRKRAAAELRRY